MAFYDNFKSRGWTNSRIKLQKAFYRRLFRSFSLLSLDGIDFLEIGPGTGLVAEVVAEFGANYSAIESNAGLVKSLSEQGYKVDQGTCPPLGVEDDSCDIIFCSHLIEHLKDPPEVYLFFEEAYRALRAGGRFIVIAPDYMRMGAYFWDCDYTHTFPVTTKRVEQLFRDTGFDCKTLSTMTEPFVGPIKYLINSLLFFYPYSLVQTLLPSQSLKTVAYKIRSTFSQVVFAIGSKSEH